MAQYLVLIYEEEAPYMTATPELLGEVMDAHNTFAEKAGPSLKGGHALQPTPTATTIRPGADGGLSVTDGPFVETKEALGGYYLIEAADLDEAIGLAKQVPARFGGVEVRPIMTFE